MVFCGVTAGGTDGEDSEESLIADGVELDDAAVFFFFELMLNSSRAVAISGKRYHRFLVEIFTGVAWESQESQFQRLSHGNGEQLDVLKCKSHFRHQDGVGGLGVSRLDSVAQV